MELELELKDSADKLSCLAVIIRVLSHGPAAPGHGPAAGAAAEQPRRATAGHRRLCRRSVAVNAYFGCAAIAH